MLTYPLHALLEVQASRGSVILASASGKLGPSGAWQVDGGGTSWSASSRDDAFVVACLWQPKTSEVKQRIPRPGGIPRNGLQRDSKGRDSKEGEADAGIRRKHPVH